MKMVLLNISWDKEEILMKIKIYLELTNSIILYIETCGFILEKTGYRGQGTSLFYLSNFL